MVNYAAKDLGKALGKMSQEQARLQENIYPDDPDAQLLLQIPHTLTVSLSGTATQKDYPDNSFILDHPVYGDLDSSTLLLDGGYAWENYLIQLRAYYDLEGDIVDSTANALDGTATAVTYTTGISGSSALFDGATSRVDLPASSTIITDNNSWSMSCWFYANSFANGMRMVNLCINGNGNSAARIFVNGTQPTFGYRNASSTLVNAYSFTASTSVWYHTVFTYDGTSYRSYVNGALVDTETATFAGFGTGQGGIGSVNGGGIFDGRVDEVGLWNRVLSAGEITNLYNSGSGRTYDLNNLSSSTLQVI